MEHHKADLVVIGSGIVGSSTALQLQQRFPQLSILLLDKESACAQHQTGHNSGVVHAGVYYTPGSLKADFCKRGATLTKSFCAEHNLPYRQCGKLLVATDSDELDRMEELRQRCMTNKISVQSLSENELKILEPHISGKGALLVPDTAITDYPQITRKMLSLFHEAGGKSLFDAEVRTIEEHQESITICSENHSIESSYLIACGGLMADRLATMMDLNVDFQIVPFRGEYFQLPADKNKIVEHLIYPIPDPDLPFLGVHLTPMIGGEMTVGPNAVLGWKREGYGKINFDANDIYSMFQFAGFWKVLKNNWKTGIKEMIDSVYSRGYLERVQKYCPQISLSDLHPYPAGIRAQAVKSDGSLVHDFLFAETDRSLHVCNAPSPAATSAFPIGEHLTQMATKKFNL